MKLARASSNRSTRITSYIINFVDKIHFLLGGSAGLQVQLCWRSKAVACGRVVRPHSKRNSRMLMLLIVALSNEVHRRSAR